MITLYDSIYKFMVYIFKYILLFPFIIIILTLIFAGIYAGIYKLNYLRTLQEFVLFYVILIYSFMNIAAKIFSIPVYIIDIIKIIIYKIGYIFGFIFTTLGYMNSIIYDMTNVEI